MTCEERDAEGVVPYRCGGQILSVIEPYYQQGLISSPLQFCCHRFRFFIQFSSCERGAGSAFLCDQRLHLGLTYSRPQNVSSCTATSQDIRFGIISLGYGCFFMVQYTLILIPKIVRFVALKMQQLMECCQIKSKIICLHKNMLENLYRCTMKIA